MGFFRDYAIKNRILCHSVKIVLSQSINDENKIKFSIPSAIQSEIPILKRKGLAFVGNSLQNIWNDYAIPSRTPPP